MGNSFLTDTKVASGAAALPDSMGWPPAAFVDDSIAAASRGSGVNAFVARNALASWRFRTTEGTIFLDLVSDGGTGRVGVLVNGAWHDYATVATDGVIRRVAVNLPGGANKVVEVWAGVQNSNLGTFLTGIRGRVTPVESTTTRRLVVYGDSIASGYYATVNERDGWVSLARADYPGRIALEAWGGRALMNDELGDAATIAARISALLFTATTRQIWLAIGTNDCGTGISSSTLPQFQARYGQLLDALISREPTATIYAQTPIVRSGEATPNGNGLTLAQYRSAIATEVAARPSVTLVNGANILTTGDLSDGTHPTAAGFVIYKAAVKAAIGY